MKHREITRKKRQFRMIHMTIVDQFTVLNQRIKIVPILWIPLFKPSFIRFRVNANKLHPK